MKKLSFDITGMTCSACSTRIENKISKLDGVNEAVVSLMNNKMKVEIEDSKITEDEIMKNVQAIGYGISVDIGKDYSEVEKENRKELIEMRNRAIISLIFAVPLFYLAMGDMLGWPLPSILMGMENLGIFVIIQIILLIPIVWVNRDYFTHGFKNIFQGSPNMDSLVALGSTAAIGYSLYATAMVFINLGTKLAHQYGMNIYYESAGVILALVTLGKYLEKRAKEKTTSSISKLMQLAPETALVLRDGEEVLMMTKEVRKGEIVIVKAGAKVPVDGVIIKGSAHLDEAMVTGESIPQEKTNGDFVVGGTMSKSGYFQMEVTATGSETTLSKIIQLVQDATSSKAPISKLVDKVSGMFVPIVSLISLITVIVWLLLGYGVEFALSNGIAVLVISCPCALGLATPVAMMVGVGRGASQGVLIKSAEALELLRKVDAVVLDKTGTITEGKPQIVAAHYQENEEELYQFAASLENQSDHPLSLPIIEEAKRREIKLLEVENFEAIPGEGIKGSIDGKMIFAGNKKMMEHSQIDITSFTEKEEEWQKQGQTILYFAKDNQFIGALLLADTIKKNSKQAVKQMKAMGLKVIMLTGDSEKAAKAIAEQVGITDVFAGVYPADKEMKVKELQSQGKVVAMVGDGINDAPSLVRADVGLAIGAGIDIALDSADIVLMHDDLLDVVTSIKLSRVVMRTVKQNLFWAFIYNVIGIGLATGTLYTTTGLLLNPMVAALAMSFSSISVVLNALRLQFSLSKKGGK